MSDPKSVFLLLKDMRWLAEHGHKVVVDSCDQGRVFMVTATGVTVNSRYFHHAIAELRERLEKSKNHSDIVSHFDRIQERAECGPWKEFIDGIDLMLEGGEYEWAEDTLSGIRQRVAETMRVTAGQQEAVENIKCAKRER